VTSITIDDSQLADRTREIRGLVAGLVANKRGIEVRQLPGGVDYIVGVLSKGVAPESVTSPELIRVPSKIIGVYLNYHERWRPITKSTLYELERAYLHIYLAPKNGVDRQILCFHYEPSTGAADASAAYKNGPHLHVGGATPSITKAHLAICVNDDDLGGEDLQALNKTLKAAIRMIELELLPKYAHAYA
jgi:hypothetical protein